MASEARKTRRSRAGAVRGGLSLALLLAGLLAAGAASGDAERPAVLLRDTQLLPPLETHGSGLEPEVKLAVSIDERGLVTEVEILSIEPSSEYDQVFHDHTVEELKRWRYAPAVRDGRPVATTLTWSVQYQAREGAPSAGSSKDVPLPGFVLAQEIAAARHERMMNLPLERRKEILMSFSGVAEKHLVRERRQHYTTENFVVVSDSESADLPKIVAHNLEVALAFIQELLQPSIEPQPSDLRRIVYLYSRRAAFEAMRTELLPLAGDKATYYAPGMIAYHLELPSPDVLLSFLIHEASHGYSDHELTRSGRALPFWLEEGFAEYMGNSRVKKGKLQPGRTVRRELVLNHQVGVLNVSTRAGWELDQVKRALRQGDLMTLEELFTADRDIFYGESAHLYYGMSWLLVHFLRHGEEDWAERSFPRMMLYIAEGYPAKAAVEAAYGRDAASLEEPFLEYARKF